MLGSKKTGFAICANGIYWDNGFTRFSGGGHIAWEEFKTARVALNVKYKIFVQIREYINISVVRPNNNHRVLALLLDIQPYINNPEAFYMDNGKKEDMQTSVIDSSTLSNNVEVMDVSDKNSDELVNINTASLEELLILPGFSIDKANIFIKERNARSGFNCIDEVCEFLDLKPHLVEQVKGKATVSIPKT